MPYPLILEHIRSLKKVKSKIKLLEWPPKLKRKLSKEKP